MKRSTILIAIAALGTVAVLIAVSVGLRALNRRPQLPAMVSSASAPAIPLAHPAPATSPTNTEDGAPQPLPSPESYQGFLYGRIHTVDGATYEGRLRWGGGEESFWDDFERIDFGGPRKDSSGPAYGDCAPGGPLAGSVITRDGRRLAGRLVYDLDESTTTDTLDAPSQGVDYSLPFGQISVIASISPISPISPSAGIGAQAGIGASLFSETLVPAARGSHRLWWELQPPHQAYNEMVRKECQ